MRKIKKSCVVMASFVMLGVIAMLSSSAQAQEGNLIWAKRAGGTGPDDAYRLFVDGAGNSYVTGEFSATATFGAGGPNATTLTSAGATDIFLAKYNSRGDLVFAKQFGGTLSDRGNGVAADNSGNIYLAGFFQGTATFGVVTGNPVTLTSAGSNDFFLAKYDSTGALIWVRGVGGAGADQNRHLELDGSGNVIVNGFFTGTVTFGLGGATPTVTLTSAGSDDIFIAKYDPNGSLLWVTQSGGTGTDEPYAFSVDASGNIFQAGYFSATATFGVGQAAQKILTSAGSTDIFVAKYNSNGVVQWVKQAGGTGGGGGVEEGRGAETDASGNVYLVGTFTGTATFGVGDTPEPLTAAGSTDIFLAKYDSNGVFLGVTRAGGTLAEEGRGGVVDAAGNGYVTGYFSGTATFGVGDPSPTNLVSVGGQDVFFAKYNSEGNLLWVKQFGGPGNDNGRRVEIDTSGNVYVVGFFNNAVTFGVGDPLQTVLTSAGAEDLFIAKIAGPGVDATPPFTTITGVPPAATNNNSATFIFSSNDPTSTFECSLDGAAFTSCVSSVTYTGLANGSHNFRVRGVDAAGNVEPDPDFYQWVVNTLLPGAPSASGTPNSWSVTGNPLVNRRLNRSTTLADGRVLTVGGVSTPGTNLQCNNSPASCSFFSSAEIYDPVTGQFTATGSLTTGGRVLHTVTRLLNGKVLVAGGWNGTASVASAEVYDPSTGLFTPTANTLSTGRSQHTGFAFGQRQGSYRRRLWHHRAAEFRRVVRS